MDTNKHEFKKVYVAHSSSCDYHNEIYSPIQKSRLAHKYDFIFPHMGEFQNSREIIKNCAFMIAEVSYPSTGLGIELAWAKEFKVPVLAVYKNGNNVSSSVKMITDNIIYYNNSDSDSLIDIIEKYLPRTLS